MSKNKFHAKPYYLFDFLPLSIRKTRLLRIVFSMQKFEISAFPRQKFFWYSHSLYNFSEILILTILANEFRSACSHHRLKFFERPICHSTRGKNQHPHNIVLISRFRLRAEYAALLHFFVQFNILQDCKFCLTDVSNINIINSSILIAPLLISGKQAIRVCTTVVQ